MSKVSVAVLAACAALLALLYAPASPYLVGMWNKEDFNYGYLVPVIVLYLLWERRRLLAAAPQASSWAGLLPLGAGLALYWLGELGGEYTLLFLSAWFVLVGLAWLHLGWARLKTVAFPVLFLLAAIPPPNFLYSNASMKLKLVSSWIGVKLLQAGGMTAYREGNVIDLGFTQLQVVDACSGLRYLLPLTVLAILLAAFQRGAWWKKAVLVASVLPLSILTNSLRIASVAVLYPVMGPKVAEGFFHDMSGWVIFMASLAFLLAEMKVLGGGFRFEVSGFRQTRTEDAPRTSGRRSPAPVFAALVLLGATAFLSHGVEFREKVPMARPLAEFPLAMGEWRGERMTLDESYLEELKLTDYALIDYRNGSGQTISFYVAYKDSQRKGESTHSPSSCLPGSGWVFKDSGVAELPAPGGGTMRVARAFMEKSGARMLTYYWFPQRGRVLTDMYQLKIFAFWDALTRQRTDGALVRVITALGENEPVEAAEARLREFAGAAGRELGAFLPR